MERRALIVYCDNTPSGELVGPSMDYENYRNFLTSYLGGAWKPNEIDKINNPTEAQLTKKMSFLDGADYTFVIFTGHGEIIQEEGNPDKQYVELLDKSVWIKKLFSNAEKQTLIIDACRMHRRIQRPMQKRGSIITASNEGYFSDLSDVYRKIFERAVLEAPGGITILYATKENTTADDDPNGAVYLSSLKGGAEVWNETNHDSCVLHLNEANEYAKKYLEAHYESIQEPVISPSKRIIYYPFAVKLSSDSISNGYYLT